jgi:uncharacterized protein YjdB
MRSPTYSLLALTTVAAFAACKSSSTAPDTVAQVVFSVNQDTLQVGDSVRVLANPIDNAGKSVAGVTVTWSSSDQSVATVDQTGLIKGVGPGTAEISATAEGAVSSLAVTVLESASLSNWQ